MTYKPSLVPSSSIFQYQAFLNIWDKTFIWLGTTVGDTWSMGQVHGGNQKWSLCPLHNRTYMLVQWYILVWTEYVLVHTGMYHEHRYISENAFLCQMTIRNDTVYAWHAGGSIPTLNKCLYLCSKCMTFIWKPLKCFSWYILGIYQVYTFIIPEPGIYLVYTRNMFSEKNYILIMFNEHMHSVSIF
jgi:hypothetical protein